MNAVAETIEPLSLVPQDEARRRPAGALAPISTDVTPMALLHYAMQRGADLDQVERFMALVREQKAEDARDAYVSDMAEFKKDPPKILKTKRVYFESRNGGATTDYYHATHADVTLPIAIGLAQHGFSHSWKTDQKEGRVHVTCTITHRLGHTDSVTLHAPPDTSGNKNAAQSIVSTKTMLERYTLLAVTGLSTADLPDDDGRGGPDSNPVASDGGPSDSPPPAAAPATYDPARFAANLPDWTERLKDRNGPGADRFIAFIESKGTPFSEEQRATLRGIKPA